MKKNNLTEEYLQDLLVRLAHHSSAIEGNKINLPDTVSIILHNTIPGNTSKRDFWEVENHKEAFTYVMENVDEGVPLSTSVIKDIHERLTDRLLTDKGRFKQSDNAIKGAGFNTASPLETPNLMEQWVGNLNYQLDSAAIKKDIVRIVVDFHIQFEKIHPFSDGNGRTGRILIIYSLLEKGISPLIIRSEDKPEYINILGNEDIDKFTEFASKRILEEDKQIDNFLNMEESVISDSDLENDTL